MLPAASRTVAPGLKRGRTAVSVGREHSQHLADLVHPDAGEELHRPHAVAVQLLGESVEQWVS